jgi:hypothetical protein
MPSWSCLRARLRPPTGFRPNRVGWCLAGFPLLAASCTSTARLGDSPVVDSGSSNDGGLAEAAVDGGSAEPAADSGLLDVTVGNGEGSVTDASTSDGTGRDGDAAATRFLVDPKGSDENPGTFDKPFRTVEKARTMARALAATMSADIVVVLRGGTHVLDTPVTFDAGDSGQNGFRIVYRAAVGEEPVLSGGRPLADWTLVDPVRRLYRAPTGRLSKPRQLYVNGARAKRAASATGIPGAISITPTGYTTDDRTLLDWKDSSDLEFVYTGAVAHAGATWTSDRCGVAAIAPGGAGAIITMREPCWTNGSVRKGLQSFTYPTAMENAWELLGQDNQWYWDSAAGQVYFIAPQGLDMARAEVVVPEIEMLVEANGTAETPFHDVSFEGLTFAHATWRAPSSGSGYVEEQADHIVTIGGAYETAPASVWLHHATNVHFTRNTFVHLGAEGLALDRGSKRNEIIGNRFADISASALRLGDVDAPLALPADQDRDSIVANNYIHDVSVEYLGGVGIWAGYVAGMRILHNEVARTPYTGISLGWGWGAGSYADANEIAYNDIHDCMQILEDGASLYTLGAQGSTSRRSTVHDNHLHDDQRESAIYHDEGSAYFEDWNNVIDNVGGFWLFLWTPTIHDIDVHDNFSDSTRVENSGTSITLARNYQQGPPWPGGAQSIIAAAGLEPAYWDLRREPNSGVPPAPGDR